MMGHGDSKIPLPVSPQPELRARCVRLGLVLLGVFLFRLSGPADASDHRDVREGDLLPRILEKAEAYCRRLGASSLDFVCREKIDERQYTPPLRLFSNTGGTTEPGLTRVLLEYDYQLIRKGGSIEEKRVLLRENRAARNEPDAELKTKLYKHKNLVFGPGGLLSEYWQPRHAYIYLGEQKIDGQRTYVVEAAPAASPEPDLVYGKAWVRQKDFAIVKIEWDQRCLSNFDQVLAMAERIGHQAEPRMSVSCTYGVEKNGIRFPDRLAIREEYWSTRGNYRVSETTVRYEDYRFFIVETEVKY
jgi:hypothetical protein